MNKVIGKPLAVEPLQGPSAAVDRSTRSPTNSASVNPPFMRRLPSCPRPTPRPSGLARSPLHTTHNHSNPSCHREPGPDRANGAGTVQRPGLPWGRGDPRGPQGPQGRAAPLGADHPPHPRTTGGPGRPEAHPVAPLRHRVGICPRSPRSGGNSTASMWSRGW